MNKTEKLKLNIENKIYRLRELYQRNIGTGKTIQMLYSVTSEDVLIANSNKDAKKFEEILRFHKVKPTIDSIEDTTKARKHRNKRLHIDHMVFEDLLGEIEEYMKLIDNTEVKEIEIVVGD